MRPLPLSTRRWPGPPVGTLLIHGLGDGAFAWDAFLPYLLRSSSAITVDLRGHGDSPWDSGQRYEREAYAADVVALLRQLEQPPIVLMGHSLGAEVAIRAAAALPELVRALVIVDGGPELNGRAAQAMAQHLKALPWRYSRPSEFVDVLANRHPLAERAVLESYASSALRRAVDGGFELKADPALRFGLSAPDDEAIWHALHRVACPKLIVRGAASSMLSYNQAQRTAARLTDCRVATVVQAGHSVPLDNPAGLHDMIGPFLAAFA